MAFGILDTTTIDLPARGDSTGAGPTGEGGEWALLLSKLQAWLGSGQLQAQLQAARTPFTLVAGLIALLVVLQIYGALLAVINSFPLAPGLLAVQAAHSPGSAPPQEGASPGL
jgi:hypothetical protein